MIKLDDEPSSLMNGRAICYSGYRSGQGPHLGIYPSYDEVLEDLKLLSGTWDYIRLYSPNDHAQTVLKVIREHELPIKVMLGVCLTAEISNPNCPWGGEYSNEELQKNKAVNLDEIQQLIHLANDYKDIIIALAAGNEATVEWTDHMVEVHTVIEYVKMIQAQTVQAVTFCENYVPWCGKLEALAEAVDFISMHTYPLWEYRRPEEGLAYTIDNYNEVRSKYPHKNIVITEAGWASNSNGRGMPRENATQENQAYYCSRLMEWSLGNNVLTFLFEAFDEDWKGSEDPLEPEKHWGIYTIDRQPKKFIEDIHKYHNCFK